MFCIMCLRQNKNCVISIKNGYQFNETANLSTRAIIYCQTHYDKTVACVIDNMIVVELLSARMRGGNVLFMILRQFDVLIRGCKDIGFSDC